MYYDDRFFKICNDPVNKGDITPFINMFLGIVLKAEENLLNDLIWRRDLYESNLKKIDMLSSRDHWDKTVHALCRELLVSALFARGGTCKIDLLMRLDIKSNTTLNSKLGILRKYGMIREEKDGNTLYYSLQYEKLDALLANCG